MKEYKSIEIKIDSESRIEDQLNVLAKEGWAIAHVITKKFNPSNGQSEFIYLLEREIRGYIEHVSGMIGSDPIKVNSNQ